MPSLSSVQQQRYDQVAAFLARNGAPAHRVISTDAIYYVAGQGFVKKLLRQFIFGTGVAQKLSQFQHFENQDDYMTAIDGIANMMDFDFDLTLRTPNATLTQLEVTYKFGNPAVDEEIFGYIREQSAQLPGGPSAPMPGAFIEFTDIAQVVTGLIEHGDGTSYYCNPRWNPDAAAGTEISDGGSQRFVLKVQYSPMGKMRWWKKLS